MFLNNKYQLPFKDKLFLIKDISEEVLRGEVNIKEKWYCIFNNINTLDKDKLEAVKADCIKLRIENKSIDAFLNEVREQQEDIFFCLNPVFSKLSLSLEEKNKNSKLKLKI